MEKLISFLYSLDLWWLGIAACVVVGILLLIASFGFVINEYIKSKETV